MSQPRKQNLNKDNKNFKQGNPRSMLSFT